MVLLVVPTMVLSDASLLEVLHLPPLLQYFGVFQMFVLEVRSHLGVCHLPSCTGFTLAGFVLLL